MELFSVFLRDEICLRYATCRNVRAKTEKQAILLVLYDVYGEGIARVFNGLRINDSLKYFKDLGIEINCKK